MDAHKFVSLGLLTQHPVNNLVKVSGRERKRAISHQDPVDITRNVATAQLDATNGPVSQVVRPHETNAKPTV